MVREASSFGAVVIAVITAAMVGLLAIFIAVINAIW